ncbi:tryptophan synthase subunit alpha, partial [Sphaerisporangium rubeum]
MTNLQTVFEKTRADRRAALIGYLPAGFPTKEGAVAAATAMVEAGCDVIEIGLPYSDPLMDGPTIQDAVHRALTNGTRIADVMRTVEGVAASGAAVLVMTYWNPVDRYGADRFARELADAGGAGVITPDLTPEESGPWCDAAASAGLGTVFLVAPSSTDDRIQAVAGCCTGFVYAASLMGVTGARTSVSAAAEGLVKRTKAHTDLPVCVGLGVGTGS